MTGSVNINLIAVLFEETAALFMELLKKRQT